MNIEMFFKKFGTEQKCKNHWILLRKTQGVSCQKCSNVKQYWLKSKEQFQCARCGFRTTLRSGTIMDSSKLPYKDWFMAMFFMTMNKSGFSALMLQRQIGKKRYEPVWAMMHKIRDLMMFRDEQYLLNGDLELDEIFVRVAHEKQPGEELKSGKGSQRHVVSLIAAESERITDSATHKGKRLGFVKIKPIEGHSSIVAKRALLKMIGNIKSFTSDKGSEFKGLSQLAEHIAVVSNKENNDKHLPWIGILTANLKRKLLGTYHSVSDSYLDRYLAEFCYKLNRRYFGLKLFERLINIGVQPYLVVN